MVAAEEQIMDAYPGSDSYAETLARLAKLMDDEKIHQDHIAQMSEASARVFLDQFLLVPAVRRLGHDRNIKIALCGAHLTSIQIGPG
jgi:hypothetical protein